MSKNETLRHQMRKVINEGSRIGCSTKTFTEWRGKAFPDAIYDRKTFDHYKELAQEYIAWLKVQVPHCKRLEDARRYTDAFLKKKTGEGVTDWQLGTYASMLAVLYKCKMTDFFDDGKEADTPKASVKSAVIEMAPPISAAKTASKPVMNTELAASKSEKAPKSASVAAPLASKPDAVVASASSDKPSVEKKETPVVISDRISEFDEFVDFCIGTGLKTNELKKLCPKAVFKGKDGRTYIRVPGDTRMPDREAIVLEEYEDTVKNKLKGLRPLEKVFKTIPIEDGDETYRQSYATILYLRTARNGKDISDKKDVFPVETDNGTLLLDKTALMYVCEKTGYRKAGSVTSYCLQLDKIAEAYA